VTLYDFLSGAVALGFFVCCLFFLRFWRRTRDGLFLAFAIAFGLFGLGQTILAVGNIPTEDRSSVYLLRLLAFALIIVAVARKNAGPKG
jgi:membrane-associated PAP2 superfamily phosphatase